MRLHGTRPKLLGFAMWPRSATRDGPVRRWGLLLEPCCLQYLIFTRGHEIPGIRFATKPDMAIS